MSDVPMEVAIRAGAKLILESALSLLDTDGHEFSNRPCSTCTTVSGIAGRPFGCVRVAQEREARYRKQQEAKP